jgi:hypothetical protein
MPNRQLPGNDEIKERRVVRFEEQKAGDGAQDRAATKT